MSKSSLELHQRRQRLARTVTQVINSDLPDDTDAWLAKFHTEADKFISAMDQGLPALRQALEAELADIGRRIKIAGAGKPPSMAINTGFKLPDDEPPAQPLPDSRFSLPSDSPKPTAPKPGPFNLPDDD